MLHRTIQIAVALSLSIVATSGTLLAQADAKLTGVVRDTHGTPQMGVTVELFGPVMATALTDLEGRYQIKNVLPGVYQLRASATLYVPSLQRQLRLAAGRRSVVNVTMTGLLDEAAWMSSSHHPSADSRDDWKWTLRSPANRPLLRLAEDSGEVSHAEGRQRNETHTATAVSQRRGGFGNEGDCGRFSIGRRTDDQRKTLGLRASSCKSVESSAASALSLATLVETGDGASVKRRFSSRVRTFPQLRNATGAPLTEVELASAERLQLGDLLSVEGGSETQLLSAGSSVVMSHPFFRVNVHSGLGWVASYSFATAVGLSQYEDLSTDEGRTPTGIQTRNGLRTESGVHQEIAARHGLGRGAIELAYHHDLSRRTAVSGVLVRQTAPSAGQELLRTAAGEGLTVDTENGTFRTFAPSYTADGGAVMLSYPLGADLELAAGYLASTGVVLLPLSANSAADRFGISRSEAVTTAVNAKIKRIGTRVVASYRWQPARTISVLAPYDATGASPYLSVHLRQSLPKSALLPPGAEITVDGENVLHEGYQGSFIARQQALLASALQELRVGLTFTF